MDIQLSSLKEAINTEVKSEPPSLPDEVLFVIFDMLRVFELIKIERTNVRIKNQVEDVFKHRTSLAAQALPLNITKHRKFNLMSVLNRHEPRLLTKLDCKVVSDQEFKRCQSLVNNNNNIAESVYETVVFNCDTHRHTFTTEIKYPYNLILYPVHFTNQGSVVTSEQPWPNLLESRLTR